MPLTAFEKQPQEKQERIRSVGIKEFSSKSYQDVSTDVITRECGISKGLLFHYFGSKKEFYLYCLDYSLKVLVNQNYSQGQGDFYQIFFSFLDSKMNLCKEHPDEMHFVNMASRENASELVSEIRNLVEEYRKITKVQSMIVMRTAISRLPLKNMDKQKVMEGLLLYTNAILQKYLLMYQETPDLFFQNAEKIKKDICDYLELMFWGICEPKG